jgi:hypothetical protein
MFYRNHSSKHLSIQVVTLAAGLALATTAILSGGEVLRDKGGSSSPSPVTARVEQTQPQFGTAADAEFASIGLAYLRAPSQQAVASAATELRDQSWGLGQPAVGQSFGTDADTVFAVESLISLIAAPTVADEAATYLGLGQPGEGVEKIQPMFGTMADADYASH